jgi:hypothetical protein
MAAREDRAETRRIEAEKLETRMGYRTPQAADSMAIVPIGGEASRIYDQPLRFNDPDDPWSGLALRPERESWWRRFCNWLRVSTVDRPSDRELLDREVRNRSIRAVSRMTGTRLTNYRQSRYRSTSLPDRNAGLSAWHPWITNHPPACRCSGCERAAAQAGYGWSVAQGRWIPALPHPVETCPCDICADWRLEQRIAWAKIPEQPPAPEPQYTPVHGWVDRE